MKHKLSSRAITLAVCLLAVLVGLLLLFGGLEKLIGRQDYVPSEDTGNADTSGRIFYNNTWYEPKESLETILVLGIDTSETVEKGSEQVDFLVLLLLDRAEQNFRLLHLNRDTMTDIIRKDMYGRDAGTFRGQLALAHAYGGNPDSGCRNTVKVVENLLYGVEIDHYISFTMDAVSILNDRVGGVTLALQDDFSHLDPTYTKGTVVTLTGTQALDYVRERQSLEDSSNLHRMERQRQYIGGLFEAYAAAVENGEEDFSLDTLLAVNAYMVSDCTADQLAALTDTMGQYTYNGIDTLPGEAVPGTSYMEFHLDDAAVQEMVIALFYDQVSDT